MNKLVSNSIYRLSLVLVCLIFAGLVFPSSVDAATPSVNTHSTSSTQVPKFGKFEVTFNINKTYPDGSPLPYYYYDSSDTPANNTIPNRTSPYGVDGITIDTVFTSPSGKTLTVPSFYYVDYSRSRSGSTEILNKVNSAAVWKTRFTPSEVGEYSYYINITDKEGTTKYPTSGTLKFTSTSSNSKGFLRVSPRDPRFMEFDNGTSFVPISAQGQWWDCCSIKSYFFDDRFAQYKQAGVNLVRLWDQNDGYNLSLEGTWDSKPTDAQAIAGPKGTYIDQADAYREDKIIESAEANGVYIELSAHGDVYWNWDASIYNEGWNTTRASWTSKYHLNYWYRNFRYRVARYGYSTSILSWENWNELGHITAGSEVYKFYEAYVPFQKSTDPYKHLITTSLTSQAYSPGFWSSPLNDIANYHDYMMISRYDSSLVYDEVNFVYRFGQCLRFTSGGGCNLGLGDGSSWAGGSTTNPKPWIWGEIGIQGVNWDDGSHPDFQQGNSGEGAIRSKQNIMWAGLFSPLGTTPIPWMSMDATNLAKYYQYTKIASNFFSNIDYNGAKFDHLPTADVSITPYTGDKVTSSNAGNIRALAMRSQDKNTILVWAQNKGYTWKNSSTTPAAASGTITIPNVPSGKVYRVEYWDTTTGAVTNGSNITSTGSISVPVNNLQKSVAIKLISTSITPANPVCDANQDSSSLVDISDYSILASNFFKTSNFGRSDINKDGIVDISDYGLLAASFFQTCVQ